MEARIMLPEVGRTPFLQTVKRKSDGVEVCVCGYCGKIIEDVMQGIVLVGNLYVAMPRTGGLLGTGTFDRAIRKRGESGEEFVESTSAITVTVNVSDIPKEAFCKSCFMGILPWNRLASDEEDELVRLQTGIRRHRDARGHDRCWENDAELYSLLPEGNTGDQSLPSKKEFLENCEKYYELRSNKGRQP